MLGGAAAAAAIAAAALLSRRGYLRRVAHVENTTRIKSWENEGGAPAPVAKETS